LLGAERRVRHGSNDGATWLQAGNPVFAQVATVDAAGQRTGLAASWGTFTYGYDRAGRLTSAGYPDGSTEADAYDPAGNRTTITATTPLSGTAVTTNTYAAADQLGTSAVTGGPQPGSTTYAYDAPAAAGTRAIRPAAPALGQI